MEAALDYLKMGTIAEKSIVLQGAGNVGEFWWSMFANFVKQSLIYTLMTIFVVLYFF